MNFQRFKKGLSYVIKEISPHPLRFVSSCNLRSKHVVDMKPYCSEFYYPETLRKTYEEESMFSMSDKKDWIMPQEVMDEVVLPPKYKCLPKRPKKTRQKKSSETMTSSSNYCGRCGYEGHNRRTCNFFPKDE
ncbi:uncharacterized protein LOC124899710 [Capsicum annuum]|uniref:uncharacterized protein LOC124899710 n=1 Tax=Capsicum annuum TaxID=4072 RepID=UPI001FB05594|nr:uncharacterized protein LOC124899710 [Capsicum annuum]